MGFPSHWMLQFLQEATLPPKCLFLCPVGLNSTGMAATSSASHALMHPNRPATHAIVHHKRAHKSTGPCDGTPCLEDALKGFKTCHQRQKGLLLYAEDRFVRTVHARGLPGLSFASKPGYKS